MEFEFAKHTEVTDLALSINTEYKTNGYTRIFLCPDVHDVWIGRILPGFNEDYESDKDSFLLEIEKVSNDFKGQKLTPTRVRRILVNDELENWDYKQSNDINELIDILDGGFGILNLKK